MTREKNRGGFPFCTVEHQVSAREVCRAYGIEHSFLISMIEYGIIEMHDHQIMDTSMLHRVGIASRLHRELQVNTAGIAIILDLLDALESARTRLSVLERHHREKF